MRLQFPSFIFIVDWCCSGCPHSTFSPPPSHIYFSIFSLVFYLHSSLSCNIPIYPAGSPFSLCFLFRFPVYMGVGRRSCFYPTSSLFLCLSPLLPSRIVG